MSTGGDDATGGDGPTGDDSPEALPERLRRIEAEPLDTRAAAYSRINDELQAALEGGDTARS